MKKAAIAANRFGLGAWPGELERIARNPETWLIDQLAGPSRPPAEIRDLPDSASVFEEVRNVRRDRRAAKAGRDFV